MSTKEAKSDFSIAYCPTMEPFIRELEGIPGIDAISVGSAGQALSMLRSGMIDGVIIGRYAKKSEISPNTSFVKLRGGQTLVFRFKTGVLADELKEVSVISYLDEERISHLVPFFGEINHLESLDDCLKYGLEVPIIIDWNDYRDDFELLIPVNERGEKVPEFRAPVLYHRGIPGETISSIKERIGE